MIGNSDIGSEERRILIVDRREKKFILNATKFKRSPIKN